MIQRHQINNSAVSHRYKFPNPRGSKTSCSIHQASPSPSFPTNTMTRIETRVTSVQVVRGFPACLAIPNPPGWDYSPPSCSASNVIQDGHIEPRWVASVISSRVSSLPPSPVASQSKTSREIPMLYRPFQRLVPLGLRIPHPNICAQPSLKRLLYLPTPRLNLCAQPSLKCLLYLQIQGSNHPLTRRAET